MDDQSEKAFHHLTSLGMLSYDRRERATLTSNDEAFFHFLDPGITAQIVEKPHSILYSRAQRLVRTTPFESLGERFAPALEQFAQLPGRQLAFHRSKQSAEGCIGRLPKELLRPICKLIQLMRTARAGLRAFATDYPFALQCKQM